MHTGVSLNSSPGGRKFRISLHEERASLCLRAPSVTFQDVTCAETGLFQWLPQHSMWSAVITSHLVLHLVSNLGYLAAWNWLSTHFCADRRAGWCRKPMSFRNTLGFLSQFNCSGPPKPEGTKATQNSHQEGYLLLPLRALMQLKICPSSLNLASPFLYWFSVRESKCQAEYSAANRCEDQLNKIIRISGSKLTFLCEETCESTKLCLVLD